jgi:hypothetical protein
VSDYETGQRVRNARDFVTARKHFLACAQLRCPAIVRKDCAQWLSEASQAAPTVVVAAQHRGADVSGVRVYVDGNLLTDGLDGRALEVNPGKHTFRFEADGFETSEQVVLVREGEHNRRVSVSVLRPGETPNDPEPQRRSKGLPVLSFVLGGVGLGGVGLFAGFGVKGLNGKSELDKLACKPNCDPTKTSVIKRDFLIADVGLAVGIVSLGAAAILLFTRGYEDRGASKSPTASKVRVDVAPVQGGGAVWLSGRF